MSGFAPSRRGVLRGASGVAALAAVGCPRPPVLPAVVVTDLLAGLDVTPAGLDACVRGLRAAPITDGMAMMQVRHTTLLRRTLDGPELLQSTHRGTVLSVDTSSGRREAALARIDDATLSGLADKLGVPPAPAPAPASAEPVAPVLRPEPLSPPPPELADLAGVGAALALFAELLVAGTPAWVELTWEAFTDDRLDVMQTGQLRRRLTRHARLHAAVEVVGARGPIRVDAVYPESMLAADPTDGRVEAAARALLENARQQAVAVPPPPGPLSVHWSSAAAAELLLAGGPDHPNAVWSVAVPPQRARFDLPRATLPRTLGWAGEPPGKTTARPLTPVHITAVDPDVRRVKGAFVVTVRAGTVQLKGETRPLPVGLRLRVPLAQLRSAVAAAPLPVAPISVWRGPVGGRVVVSTQVPPVVTVGCSIEGAHVG